MAEVAERVAKLEERLDGLSRDMGELRQSMGDLRHEVTLRFDGVDRCFLAMETRMAAGFASLGQRIDGVDQGLRSDIGSEIRQVREGMQTQFHWLLGGIGGAVLAILLTLASVLIKL